MDKKLVKGCEVYMSGKSGCIGFGNIQCVKDVCEPLGEVSLYGHNKSYQIYDIREIVSYPAEPAELPVSDEKYWVEKSIIDDGIPEGKNYIFHRIGQGRASTLKYLVPVFAPVKGYSLEDMENAFEAGESLQYWRDMEGKDGFDDLGKPKEFSEFIYPPTTPAPVQLNNNIK